MVYSCTDWNDVDEDLTAISVHGGGWSESIRVGAARRTMNDTLTSASVDVAYKYNKNSTPGMRVEFYMICSNLWICQITEE